MDDGLQRLIDQYIQCDPSRPTPDEAILLPSRVKVWAVIGHLRSVDGDVPRVAKGYDVPEDAVRAAAAYYDQYRTLIDNRLERNVTPAARLAERRAD